MEIQGCDRTLSWCVSATWWSALLLMMRMIINKFLIIIMFTSGHMFPLLISVVYMCILIDTHLYVSLLFYILNMVYFT